MTQMTSVLPWTKRERKIDPIGENLSKNLYYVIGENLSKNLSIFEDLTPFKNLNATVRQKPSQKPTFKELSPPPISNRVRVFGFEIICTILEVLRTACDVMDFLKFT